MAEISIPQLIRNAAEARGVDPDVALKIAERESSLDPTAKNKRSSAYGLFQVTDDTWKQYGGNPAKRRDLQENVRVGLDVISSNRDTFIKQFGREPNSGELYTMHFLGRTGGPKLLKSDPSAPVSSVVSPRVLKANPDIKNKTVGEFIASMQQKMGAPRAASTVARTEGTVPMPSSPRETMQRQQRPRIEPLAEGPVTRDMLANLGPSYQAALGAITLGDSREDDDEESLTEQYAAMREEEEKRAEGVPRSAALANLDLSYQSPFPEEQPQAPVMLARGGVVHRRDGSPIYGEMADTGPITADTRAAFANRQGLSAAELLRMLKGVGSEGVSNLESIARGSVSAVPGLVGDIESIFRSDKERKFATTPEVERQYLPSRLTKPTKESAGFTEMGTFIDPTIAGKVARPVAQGTAKAMMAGVKAAGPQIEATLSKMAPAATPMHVVKPTGGTTYPASMVSKIDDYLHRLKIVSIPGIENLKGKDAKKIIDFVNTKGRDYLTKRYGSPQDAVKEAILDGRVTLTGTDAELFPPRLLAEAREGNPVALERFEEIYDKNTGLQGTVVFDNLADPKAKVAKEKEWEKLLKEGALPHEINLNVVGIGRKDLGKGYGSDAEAELRKFLAGEKTPPKEASAVMYAAKHGEPIYDLDSMYPRFEFLEADTVMPALVSVVDDLDKMSFPEALIRGMQKTDVLRNDEAAIKRAAQGKSVPVELFQKGVEPIAQVGDFSLVRVKSPFAVRMEGAAMRHSIGNYATDPSYGFGGKKAFESGKAQVFSIRNAEGKPIVSMDAEISDGGGYYGYPMIGEIRAVFNGAPNAQEKEAIFKAFDTFFPNLEPGELDAFLPIVKYKNTREGLTLPLEEQTKIDWWQEYTNYLRKKDAN